MKRKILFVSFTVLFLALLFHLPAQVVITNDSTAADSSAMLDVKSTSKGITTPRMTLEQIQSILNPAVGLVVFCTTDNNYYTYIGSDSVNGKGTGGSLPAWASTGTQPGPPCCPQIACGCFYLPHQTTYTTCQYGFPIQIPPPTDVAWCPDPVEYSWTDPAGVASWSSSNPPLNLPMLTCGKFTYTWRARIVGGSVICQEDINVFVFPDCPTIRNLSKNTSATCMEYELEFCEGEFGDLSLGCDDKFSVSWDYHDDNGPPGYQTWCPPGTATPCIGNPVNTNKIAITCPVCLPGGPCFVEREYRATVDLSKLPAGWPSVPPGNCIFPQGLSIPAKIYCRTQAGSLDLFYSSNPFTVSGNTYKICSDFNGDCIPDYPVVLYIVLNGQVGEVINESPAPFLGIIITINNAGTTEYAVTVKNGPCDEETTSIRVIIEDPFCPTITNTKEWVCPNKTDDIISLDNPANLPAGATIQWYYQINCQGDWYFYPGYYKNGPGNGTSQNTNLIGYQNPFYRIPGPSTQPPPNPPVSTDITTSLCWRAEITPAAGSACPGPTSSPPYGILFPKGRINLIQKPGSITLSSSQTAVQCCGTPYTLTVSGPSTGTPPFEYQLFHNGAGLPSPGPGTTFNITDAGDYFAVVYNMNHCDSAISNTIHITCCSVAVDISAPCCSDGVTPINLVATGTSSGCVNATPYTYSWSGPCSYTSVSPTAVLNPPPTFPPREWIYTVTVTNVMGCTGTKSVTIQACP